MSPALAKVRADMARHRRLFDLREDGLGAALCKAATDGVQDGLAAEQAPDGTPWEPLSPAYAAWKEEHLGDLPMAVLHRRLSDHAEVAGVVSVSADSAAVTYGVSAEARDEARWFQEGDPAANRPPRPFWGFTASGLARARAILDARFSTIK